MSELKVNKISPRSGTEVTLGDSGDTFTIPSGATINNQGTATNFGATGSASWVTTVKTSTFTAVAGEGYFVNTTGGAVTVNLPAGVAGAVVAIKDYASKFNVNNCTIDANGSDKIGGLAGDVILATAGIAVTLIFIDSTQGWLVTDDGIQSSADNNPFMVATGGTITCDGNCRVHTFTGPGTFNVSEIATSAANNEISYIVVAGGGGGAHASANGQGAGAGGGFREDKSPITPYTASPLDGAGPITVTATGFPITVGGGGAGSPGGNNPGSIGSNSIFSTITSTGGGFGANNGTGGNGGSGGGGGGCIGPPAPQQGGAGNTPPVSPSQGFPGGSGMNAGVGGGGGGGGATAVGANVAPGGQPGGNGGAGATTGISGSSTAFSGGGGGGSRYGSPDTGGTGGTGGGGNGGSPSSSPGNAGTVNTGGGGGGGAGGAGGTGWYRNCYY